MPNFREDLQHNNLRLSIILCALFASPMAHASTSFTSQDIMDILYNLQSVLTPAMGLLLTVSFIVGIVFILRGLLLLKAFSQPLTQATRPGEIAGPMVYLVVGTVMIYIPTSTDALSATLFGSVNSIFPGARGANEFTANLGNVGDASTVIMGYADSTIENQWAVMIDTIVLYMQFIGFLAFLRGWMLIAHAGQPGVQPGSISKGIVHIVGGILAINFLPLVQAVHNTIVGG